MGLTPMQFFFTLYIEQRFELPEDFKRSVTLKLRRLVLTGELEKVDKRFKIKGSENVQQITIEDVPSDNEEKKAPNNCDSPVDTETIEDN
ncbi:hypothetical protein L1887_14756 [Cichorium endivia]|nr:hypothetical protein L1887_14756 [Cichorium endivia]